VATGEDEAQPVVFDALLVRQAAHDDGQVRLPAFFVKGLEALERRMPSIALKRPETSHARGFAGRRRAATLERRRNASCMASSARSKSPSRRINVASTRRDSRDRRRSPSRVLIGAVTAIDHIMFTTCLSNAAAGSTVIHKEAT